MTASKHKKQAKKRLPAGKTDVVVLSVRLPRAKRRALKVATIERHTTINAAVEAMIDGYIAKVERQAAQ